MNARKLPHTDSVQEPARFWDGHDVTDFEGELEEVSEPAFERKTAIVVRLTPDEADAVKELAKSKASATPS